MEEKFEQTRNKFAELIKVVLYGPESTGKTTLAKQLAAHYNTLWVPEFMREYLENKWEENRELISKEDLVPIAQGQLSLETELSKKVDNLLICDTDLLELKVYSEYYYNGFCPDFIKNKAIQEDGTFYLLTYIDIPWQADILRDRPNNREEMFRIFEAELERQNFPYQILKGNEPERLKRAIEIIDALLTEKSNKMFTEKHIKQIKEYGLSATEVSRQLGIFKKGIPFANVEEAASLGNGIEVFSETEQQNFANLFMSQKEKLELLKFVPASGAATRMFKFLHGFLENYDPKDDLEIFLQNEENSDLRTFFDAIGNFAFSATIFRNLESKYPEYKGFEKGIKFFLFVQEMLGEDGLNFSNTPKGLVPFHKYNDGYITAFGEQLYEAAFYATSNGVANIHFTVSEEHQWKFKKRYGEIQDLVEKKTGVKFNISYSFQKKETDTIASTLDDQPFFDEEGNLIFRPSGHGALLENLNEIDADIIFIKNIDNVVSEKFVEIIAFHKKVLAGKLLSLQKEIFNFTERLNTENPSVEILKLTADFIAKKLQIKDVSPNKESLLNVLERPLRICGVVENTGAPGGGPFLVKNKEGATSYQIVELSQIDIHNPVQRALVDRATHFNPVDLVCGIRNYKGEKFDLTQFTDPDAGFISEKSYQGKPIKALERPGLWNGAMANWNTVFVEVPLITFNPVKTVNDLLNEAHQS